MNPLKEPYEDYEQTVLKHKAQRKERMNCSVCQTPTDLACADCRIDLGTSVYVCRNALCRDAHESKCPHQLMMRLDTMRTELIRRVKESGEEYKVALRQESSELPRFTGPNPNQAKIEDKYNE